MVKLPTVCCLLREKEYAENMGKKGSWFSEIKRIFTHNSKEKLTTGTDKKSSKEKKKGKGILGHGETKSFIPFIRKPSSIETILGEADQLHIRPPTPSNQLKSTPSSLERPSSERVASPKVSSPRFISPTAVSAGIASTEDARPRCFTQEPASSIATDPKSTQSRTEISYVPGPEPISRNQHISATKIQAAYRGYLARRSFRALRGLVRLQGVVRGQNVKRQTMNAMKQMQLLVRVQTQIQSRRIQMLENQALQRQAYKEVESTLSKWNLNRMSDADKNEDWDDSLLTKEEEEARLQKKVEAAIKRDRALAYAHSHKLWRANPKSAQSPFDIQSNRVSWWWNWLERQVPPSSASCSQAATRNISSTPPRTIEQKPSPQLHAGNYKHDKSESVTPRSSRSAVPVNAKPLRTPSRTPPLTNRSSKSKPRASAANSAYDAALNDNDSLTSCPPFSVPNYMTPTVSAKAKARANSNPKERLPGTPGNDSKRRFSFPLSPNIGSFKWTNKDSPSQTVLDKNQPSRPIDELSLDSTVSMPAVVGRKPFNRFV